MGTDKINGESMNPISGIMEASQRNRRALHPAFRVKEVFLVEVIAELSGA